MCRLLSAHAAHHRRDAPTFFELAARRADDGADALDAEHPR